MTNPQPHKGFSKQSQRDLGTIDRLIRQFPFAQHLHVLKAKYTKKHNDLLTVEIHSPNKLWSLARMEHYPPTKTAKVINLKTETTTSQKQQTNQKENKPADTPPEQHLITQDENLQIIEFPPHTTQQHPVPNTPIDIIALEYHNTNKKLKPPAATTTAKPKPDHRMKASSFNPKKQQEDQVLSPFASWLSSLKPIPQTQELTETKPISKDHPTEQVATNPKAKAKHKKKKKKKKKNDELDRRFISEPLARLMWSQGHHKLAIKMFEHLALKNPNKKRYFAAQIKNLKKNK